MKTLNNDQQQELQELFVGLQQDNNVSLSVEQQSQVAYWINELKPKRVRRLPKEEQDVS